MTTTTHQQTPYAQTNIQNMLPPRKGIAIPHKQDVKLSYFDIKELVLGGASDDAILVKVSATQTEITQSIINEIRHNYRVEIAQLATKSAPSNIDVMAAYVALMGR